MHNNDTLPDFRWGFAGGKPEGLEIIEHLAQRGFPPAFIVPPESLPHADRECLELASRRYGTRYLAAQSHDQLAELAAGLDLLLLCRYDIIPEKVFAAPRLGSVNIHPSLLPKYRGVHPISWALINGETHTGVTLHRVSRKIDEGEILYQKSVAITDSDDIWSLTDTLRAVSTAMSLELFDFISLQNALPPSRPQAGTPSVAPRRTPDDGLIDWSWPSRRIFNLVRALRPPLPPAFWITEDSIKLGVVDCRLSDQDEKPSDMDGWRQADTGDGTVYVLEALTSDMD